MSWIETNWSEVPADNDLLPEGQDFVFELLKGAKYSPYDAARVDFGAKVAEGEFKGRVTYASYPDPEKYDWVKGVFRRFLNAAEAQGFEEIEKGQDPVDYMNKVAGMKFKTSMKHRVKQSGGDDVVVAELKITNIKPVVKQ